MLTKFFEKFGCGCLWGLALSILAFLGVAGYRLWDKVLAFDDLLRTTAAAGLTCFVVLVICLLGMFISESNGW